MLKFIQSSIKDKGLTDNEPVSMDNNNDDSEAILEFAKVFQELDDLTMEGTDDPNDVRKIGDIDIPLDDDVEAEIIEFNLSDGRINDVPGDANVMESNYSTMKSFEDFYQEAVCSVVRFTRESDEAYENRVIDKANELFREYSNYIVQEGLFGFGMIKFEDDRVPKSVVVDLGYIEKDKAMLPYMVKLPVYYQIDKKKRIHKKQLDSINKAVSLNVWSNFGNVLEEFLRGKYFNDMKDVKNVWDVATPKRLLVPVEPMDHFAVYLELEYDFDNEPDYWIWKKSINGNSNNKSFANEKLSGSVSGFMSKKDYIKESYEMNRPSRFGNLYQEAIDFDGNTSGEASNNDANTTPSNSDNLGLGNEPDISVDGSNNDTIDTQTDNKLVGSNDVSGEIAEKVSAELSDAENNTDGIDAPTDDQSTSDIPDLPTDDSSLDNIEAPTNDNIDQSIDDLNGDSGGNVSSDMDVENMTLDELVEQGTQRLKGMTIAQIKDFLNGGSESGSDIGTTADIPTDDLQEAFINGTDEDIIQEMMILTKKNINRTIDVSLRNALGILNDSEKDVNTIITEFKKEGKKLNKILSKAAKMKKVYSENECNDIASLNKCLVDLMAVMKTSDMKSDAATVKRMIKAFAAQAAVVAKIVEGKNGGKSNG